MNVAKIISKTIEDQRHDIKWVAGKVDIPYTTFLYKLKNDNFLAEELLKISKLLNINLEELKNKI
ncbi:TPA: hypothetical protein ACXDAZ_002642 [Clostridium botulinum]